MRRLANDVPQEVEHEAMRNTLAVGLWWAKTQFRHQIEEGTQPVELLMTGQKHPDPPPGQPKQLMRPTQLPTMEIHKMP